jgi:hypothetical protein
MGAMSGTDIDADPNTSNPIRIADLSGEQRAAMEPPP